MPESKIMPIPEGVQLTVPLLGGGARPRGTFSGDQAAKLRKRKTSAQPSVFVVEKSFRPRVRRCGRVGASSAAQLAEAGHEIRSSGHEEAVAAISAASDAAKSPDVLLIGSKQRHGFGEQLLHALVRDRR